MHLVACQKSDPMCETHRGIERKDRVGLESFDHSLAGGKQLSRNKPALPFKAQRDDTDHPVPDGAGHLADHPFSP
jgi:hypothetical protein